MYDEVMQLIALAKNDEQYFKRIEDLKQKQLELAHVMEIAATLKEADMHLAKARQQASEIEEEARKKAIEIESSALAVISDNKSLLDKNKLKQKALTDKEEQLNKRESELSALKKELDVSIEEHRKLTAARSEEMEKAKVVRVEFETKLKKLRELAAL